jgi:precorrin-4 methylase
MTITNKVARSQVTTQWAMWVSDPEKAEYAVLMETPDNDAVLWVATDGATANTYARVNGAEFAARIVDDEKPWAVVDHHDWPQASTPRTVIARFDTEAEAKAFKRAVLLFGHVVEVKGPEVTP